jgi:hypothetical protein
MIFNEAADGLNFVNLRLVKKDVADQIEYDARTIAGSFSTMPDRSG